MAIGTTNPGCWGYARAAAADNRLRASFGTTVISDN